MDIEVKNEFNKFKDLPKILPMVKPDIVEGLKEVINITIKACDCLQIWLFGSQAKGKAKRNSDVDIYIVIEDDDQDHTETICNIYTTLLSQKKLIPIEILMEYKTNFEYLKDKNSIAGEVINTGVLIYG